MLQGLNPVIIFKIWNKDLRWVEGATLDTTKIGEKITLKEWQDMSELDKLTYYTPKIIPIYLSEDIFKIACDDAEQNISVSTTTIDKYLFQNVMSNSVVFQIRAAKDNTLMMLLLSALSEIMKLLSTQHYSVTLYYDSVFVLNGVFSSIAQATVQNTNEKVVTLTISEAPYQEEKKEDEENKTGTLRNTAAISGLNPGVA